MAHLLGVDRISLRFGTRVLFDSLTLGIDDGDRIGVPRKTPWRRHTADWKARE
ncbi:MAG: hypothetical protein FWG25_01395 [Promicromonosporaceae bacterium]|nr:hypothetical protein [Promicromonosporaceae bacterium]